MHGGLWNLTGTEILTTITHGEGCEGGFIVVQRQPNLLQVILALRTTSSLTTLLDRGQ